MLTNSLTFPRTRVSNQLVSSNPCVYNYTSSEPAFADVHDAVFGPGNVVGSVSTISDSQTSSFRKRMKSGEIIMNSMRLDRSVYQASPVTFRISHNKWGSATYSGDLISKIGSIPPVNIGVDIDNFASIALTQAFAKMNSAPLLSGEILSDLGKTMSMFRRPLGQSLRLLGRMLKYRNKRLGKTTASLLKANASAWLEYRYGWRPIIGDMIKLCREVHNLRESMRRKRLVVRSSFVGESSGSATFVDLPWLGSGFSASGIFTRTQKGKAHAGIVYEVKESTSSDQLLQTLGLHGKDLPSTVWEIIPFSFVADWFVNTGAWISAVTPNPFVQVLGSWVTQIIEDEGKISASGKFVWTASWAGPPYPETTTGSIGSYTVKHTIVSRAANPQLPTSPVPFKRNLNLNQTLDALALSVGSISDQLKNFRH